MATAIENNILEAQARTAGSKNEARRVRREGKVPGVLYGAGEGAVPLSLDPRQILRILHSQTGHNTILDLTLADGKTTKAMIVDWQYEPIKGALLHIDLKRIAMNQKLHVRVPIVLKGEAAGVKTQGGILEQTLRELEIECLPVDIPTSIETDVTHLVFGTVLRVSDLPHHDKLKVLTEANQMVAHIIAVKEEVAVTPEAVAEAAAATPAEPEVIKKGKVEAEEESAEAEKPEKAEKAEKVEKKEKK
jgi:large subunit ribosomal protein L25